MKDRREFLKFVGKSTAVAALSPMIMSEELHGEEFSDYKAIVYIMLQGGNDAFNMVVPTTATADSNDADAVGAETLDVGNGWYNYKKIRTNIAVPNVDLSSRLTLDADGNLDISERNPYGPEVTHDGLHGTRGLADDGLDASQAYLAGSYHINNADGSSTGIGINAVMPEVAHLMNTDKLAVIGNVGILVEPVTRADVQAGIKKLPIHMYAHNHQQRLCATGIADDNKIAGWAGRLFKELGNINGADPLGNNISLNGYSHLLTGNIYPSLSLSATSSGYDTSDALTTLNESLASSDKPNPFERVYGTLINRAYRLTDTLDSLAENPRVFTTLDSYGAELFSVPTQETLNFLGVTSGKLISQLEVASKLIDHSAANGVKRQIFYVNIAGFDTHNDQVYAHPLLLREISMGLSKFQLAMEELGLSDKVTTMTVSDFGRSSGNNGDGTDHAWAGHNLVMGGAVKSGFYGEVPDFTPGGPQDASSRGRMIPTVAVEQQYATVLKWFGVNDTILDTVFLNLANFNATRYGRDMGFMESV